MLNNEIVEKAIKNGFDEKYYTSWIIAHFGGAMVAKTIMDDKLDDRLRAKCMREFVREVC